MAAAAAASLTLTDSDTEAAQTRTIPLRTANITVQGGEPSSDEYGDPSVVICPGQQSDSNTTWLLQDSTAGSWTAQLDFEIYPRTLRLYNSRIADHATQTFRMVAWPLGGIMNLTYSSGGENVSCTAECPLSNTESFQDFDLVNYVGMTGFTIYISAWYGDGGGLAGIELFDDQVNTYAVDAFNSPCVRTNTSAYSTHVGGPWSRVSDSESGAPYLSANLSGSALLDSSVTFYPEVKDSGNYSVLLFTPGCVADGTCSERGAVTVSTYYASDREPSNVTIYESNYYYKYDTVYEGEVLVEDGFRPYVVLAPTSGQSGVLTVVAQQVQFNLVSVLDTEQTNYHGLYEYGGTSTLKNVSSKLSSDAKVSALAAVGDNTLLAGDFVWSSSGSKHNNVLVLDENHSVVNNTAGGLNGAVMAAQAISETAVVLGGRFNQTKSGNTELKHLARFSSTGFDSLEGGVDGTVTELAVWNTSNSTTSSLLAVTGDFSTCLFSNGSGIACDGFGLWDEEAGTWQTLEQLPFYYSGSVQQTATGSKVFAGTLNATQELSVQGALTFAGSEPESYGLTLGSSAEVNAAVLVNGTTSSVILGGHFTLHDGSHNLVMADNGSQGNFSNSKNSTILALMTHGRQLYAGGMITVDDAPDVSGLVLYELENHKMASVQPAGLYAEDGASPAAVQVILGNQEGNAVYVGGNFSLAGSLSCPGLCVYTVALSQWSAPAPAVTNGTVNSMIWQSSDTLLLGGKMTINSSDAYVASYDTSKREWSTVIDSLPGPVLTVTMTNTSNDIFVAGQSERDAPFIYKWDGDELTDLLGSGNLSAGSLLTDMYFVQRSSSRDSSSVLPDSYDLLVTGRIKLASHKDTTFVAAVLDGDTWTPFLTASSRDPNMATRITSIQTNAKATFRTEHHLARGYVVLIGLALALAITFLMVAIGYVVHRIRRRLEGYESVPAYFKGNEFEKFPPQQVVAELSRSAGAPQI